MKPIAISLLLLSAVIPAFARKHQSDVTVTTDRFTNETTVQGKLFQLGSFRGGGYNNGTFYFDMSATFPNNQGYFIGLVIDANEWQYVRGGGLTVHFIADGQHFDAFFKEGSTRVPVTAAGVSTQEILTTFPPISAEQFGKMANAQDLEIEIGPYAFKFNARGIQHFKDLFDAVQALPSDLRAAGAVQPQPSDPVVTQPPKPASSVPAVPGQLISNSEAAKSSPAAAAAAATVGHVYTPEELADLVRNGKASRCAVITTPPGAEIFVDGNKAGVSPLVFVLLRNGDAAQTLTIKLNGYRTVEKTMVPDGKIIPLGLTLEKE